MEYLHDTYVKGPDTLVGNDSNEDRTLANQMELLDTSAVVEVTASLGDRLGIFSQQPVTSMMERVARMVRGREGGRGGTGYVLCPSESSVRTETRVTIPNSTTGCCFRGLLPGPGRPNDASDPAQAVIVA